MGGNAKHAAVYTRQLARSLISSLSSVLHDLGDERFLLHETSHESSVMMTNIAFPTTEEAPDYVDLQKDPEMWAPLLKEAAERLEGKVATYATVKPSAYLEQIKMLVPWHLQHVQIYRTPKVRRVPTAKMLETPDITHRGAALLYQDGTIEIESQDLADVSQPSKKFDRTVRVAIFLYGKPMAVETSKQRQALRKEDVPAVEPEQTMAEWEPGARDITFPGLSEDQLPKWMRSVLKRVHTNLGHPHNSTLVRQLSQANASSMAMMGARALKCAVCERLRPPREQRPAKSFPITKRFNERVMLDLIFVKDMAGDTFIFLNQVDDTTTYQVLTLLENREGRGIMKALSSGWFRFFGLPEALLLDAEGAMKSFDFEELMAQSGIQVRFIPPDAHHQLGKGERHGDIAREMMYRLVHQHGIIGAEGMDMIATMTTHAKNTLARRAGASPAQWVLGQNPRIPASLISETENAEAMHQLTLSRRLQMIERVRTDAMKLFLDFDNDASLRQAMLRRSRPWRGPYEIGQKVVYWRLRNSLDNEGAQPGYRQGIILAADPGPSGSLWLRNDRGRVVQVAREQVRNLQGDEAWIPGEPDFALLRETEGDLDRKHAVQHDLRDGIPPASPAPMDDRPEHVPLALPDLPQPVLSPEGQAVDEIPPAQEGLVHDAPLDFTGRPLEHEHTTPQEPIEMDTSSRRPSVAPSLAEPFDPKRQKTRIIISIFKEIFFCCSA